MWNWITFLDRRKIAYDREGHSVRLPCPFCPPNTRRMSIEIGHNRGWWCFVGKHKHSGVSPTRLVAGLLKCSFEQAFTITGVGGRVVPTSDEFTAKIAAMRGEISPETENAEFIHWMPEFKPIDDSPMRAPFVNYLEDRGFTYSQIMGMTNKYGLHCCRNGRFRYRLIFPVRIDGRLVAWSARSISKSHCIRYLAEGKPPDYLLWFDELKQGGECIVLTEGPFDALKLRILGQPATCFFTSGPSPSQIDLLRDLLPAYKRKVLLLDRGTIGESIRTQADLFSYDIEPVILKTRKDPGEIRNARELQQIIGI